MLEPQRLILLPAPESAGPSGRARSSAVAPWIPVPSVPATLPVPGAAADDLQDAGAWSRRPPLDDEADEAAGRRRGFTAGSLAGASPGGRVTTPTATPFGSVAFLAQQIFQEAMSSGLHLEPWTQGIGAYRRAGAAPPLESGAPTLFSVAV